MWNRIKILIIGVVIVAIILGGVYVLNHAEQKESGVLIYYNGISSQGQGGIENLSGMESVKVHGMVGNTGDKEAKNVTVSVIFTDTANNEVVRKMVIEGVDLLPNGVHYEEFDTEYFRELTIPKTSVDVTIQVDWEEEGQLRTMAIPSI